MARASTVANDALSREPKAVLLVIYCPIGVSKRGVRRPRFVIVLCAAATVGAFLRVFDSLSSVDSMRSVFGVVLQGDSARVLGAVEAILLVAVACGLWALRAWARKAAMAYLAAIVVSFLFFGVTTDADSRAAWTLVWQVSMVPFATFCFMFLYNGERYFGAPARSTAP